MLKEMITKSMYKTENVGVYDLSEYEKNGDFSHQILIDEILAQGDRIGYESNVKAPMTEWNMCLHSAEFTKLANIIVRNGVIPYLAQNYMNEEDIKKNSYAVVDMWGAEYRGNGEDFTQSHDHRASFCSFSYYIQTPKGCPPLIFDELNIAIDPTPGMLVCFKGDNKHSVPKAKHEGSRIMIAGNTTVVNPVGVMVEVLRSKGFEVNEPVSNT
mgnify:FL=1